MRKILLPGLIVLFYSCSPVSKSALTKTFTRTEKEFNDHVGFVLYDPAAKKTVFEYQSDRYFTPGSNTKIITLFAALKILGDSIPALYYTEQSDSLIIWGSGDPGFLYKNVFSNNRTYQFLASNTRQLFLSTSNFYTEHFGPGWAWDDYNWSYSSERSPFPVYGNILSVEKDRTGIRITPGFFTKFLTVSEPKEKAELIRDQHSNNLTFNPSKTSFRFKADVPFRTDSVLTSILLEDTLHKTVQSVHIGIPGDRKTFYSIPSDSLYRVMMQESDNFIAEQLLLICSSVLSDSLKPEITIDYVKKNFFSDLKDELVWVDGSGLSRYNLFTPRSVVQVWEKISEITPRERLFPLLAIGGKNGTLLNWYKEEPPYIFGKTGTLSNNHCLSGFLVTKKGKTFIFSFMNSNFARPGNDVRNSMQRILKEIYENY